MRTLKKIGIVMFGLGLFSLFLELFYLGFKLLCYGNEIEPEWCVKWASISFIIALIPISMLILFLIIDFISYEFNNI